MLTATALRLAAERSTEPSLQPVLCGRPRGVLHVYCGPLTPGGGGVPRRGRPVCRATASRRRLYVVPQAFSSVRLGGHVSGRRLCARCSARLAGSADRAGHPDLRSAAGIRAHYAGLSVADLLWSVWGAATDSELDWCEYLALELLGRRSPAYTPRTSDRDRVSTAIARARTALAAGPFTDPPVEQPVPFSEQVRRTAFNDPFRRRRIEANAEAAQERLIPDLAAQRHLAAMRAHDEREAQEAYRTA